MSAPGTAGVSARLLLLLDSRSPAGAHSHSGGMEAAVQAGYVRSVDDVRDFCHGRLHSTTRVSAAFAATACQLWQESGSPQRWLMLDEEFSARTPSEAMRESSRALGGGLLRLVRATVAEADLRAPFSLIGRPHHPLVLGAGCALAGGDAALAARSAALGQCASAASAAVRLLGLDPYAVHTVTAQLSEQIEEVVTAVTPAGAALTSAFFAALPADSAPALDLLADVHAREGMRLFAS